MVKGTVKWFDVRKGYGYVADENGNDYFAHFSGITKGRHHFGLKDGDFVTFEVTEGKKGPQAINVTLVETTEAYNGTVKWFDVRKGYGYVTDIDGNDYFVHSTGITKGRSYVGLKDNDSITFEVTEGKKGPQATNIEIINTGDAAE